MTKKKTSNVIIFCILCVLVVAFLTPIFFVLINSFKGKLFISNNPFALPTAETFVGLTNYVNGIEKPVFHSFRLVCIYHCIFRGSDHSVHFHDCVLSDQSENRRDQCAVLHVRIFHDRAFPDGNVHYVQAG